ncbi:MAG: hypothetical protein QWI73_06550, partial [Alphaproteobacteria bacterium]|nr:hypothetical protein [Alphaproteobacteria bacterium]
VLVGMQLKVKERRDDQTADQKRERESASFPFQCKGTAVCSEIERRVVKISSSSSSSRRLSFALPFLLLFLTNTHPPSHLICNHNL